MEYKHLSFYIYQTVIMTKVTQYIKTKAAKRIKASISYGCMDEIKLEYDINEGANIKFDHLLSLTLYTDLSGLSYEFSSTFRAVNNYESLQSIKARNADYFWMSRYLRELVQIYGNNYSDWDDEKLKGPFYCGLSRLFLFQSLILDFVVHHQHRIIKRLQLILVVMVMELL